MKKNKNIKIFTFILLLCTIFSTLLFINPTSKAETTTTPPSDLTGYTVTVPYDWYASRSYGIFEINFSSSVLDDSYDALYIGYIDEDGMGNVTPASDRILFFRDGFPINGLNPSNDIEIFITDGVDTTNQSLIQWFVDNNATFTPPSEPEPDPTYTISGQYQFNDEVTWLYDTSEQEGILYLPFYVYNLDNSTRVNYNYMLNQYREDLDINYFFYANETNDGVFTGQYAGTFSTPTIIKMFGDDRIIYFYTAEVSEEVYNWLNDNGQFINDPTLDPNNPENPDSGNNPNNPNNPDFGTDTVRQIVNQVNAFLGIQIFPGLSFRDILLICVALPLLMYILKVFLGG